MKRIFLGFLLTLCITNTEAYRSYQDLRASVVRNTRCMDTENVRMQDMSTFPIDGSNPQLKCFEACILEQAGVVDNCTVGEDNLANFGMLEEFQDALASCKESVKGSDRCECAYQLSSCINEKLPEREES